LLCSQDGLGGVRFDFERRERVEILDRLWFARRLKEGVFGRVKVEVGLDIGDWEMLRSMIFG